MNISGRHVVITGGGTGIGRAIALAFANAGARVTVVGRRLDPLRETAGLAAGLEGSIDFAQLDVTQEESIRSFIRQAEADRGPIAVWYNNAGSFQCIGPAHEVDPEEWWRDVTINLFGPFLCCRVVLPLMIERGEGIVINMDGGRPSGGSAYASSKAGLEQFTKIVAKELRTIGSEVIVLRSGPGLVRTEMTEYQVNTEKGRRWIPGTKQCFDEGRLFPAERIAEKAVEIVRAVTPRQSGAAFGPGTDVNQFLQETGD
jgi:NAD(P)-dependent dehydrogenase (short-subunit alcohol dehydrogenase family)